MFTKSWRHMYVYMYFYNHVTCEIVAMENNQMEILISWWNNAMPANIDITLLASPLHNPKLEPCHVISVPFVTAPKHPLLWGRSMAVIDPEEKPQVCVLWSSNQFAISMNRNNNCHNHHEINGNMVMKLKEDNGKWSVVKMEFPLVNNIQQKAQNKKILALCNLRLNKSFRVFSKAIPSNN